MARNKHYTETRIREAKEDERVGLETGAVWGSLQEGQAVTAGGHHPLQLTLEKSTSWKQIMCFSVNSCVN